MGMKKLTEANIDDAVRVIENWPINKPFTWEAIRAEIARRHFVALEDIWTRQTLSFHGDISEAYTKTKDRLREAIPLQEPTPATTAKAIETIASVNKELAELRWVHNNLLLRHNELCYQVSLLPGGLQLLDIPIPNNTKTQA